MTFTYADALDHVLAFAGLDASQGASTQHRRAVQAAIQVIPTRHDWKYYVGLLRVTTTAPYSTGTIAVDVTGGTYENMVTLTGGVWPSWIADGYLVIANVPYQVLARKSDTIITLVAQSAPAADIAAGTSYQALRDRYTLPVDFVSGDEAVVNDVGTVLTTVHPRDWSSQRRVNSGPGQPVFCAYVGSPTTRGRMAIAIWPPSDISYSIDLLYKRKPNPIVYEAVSGGLVSASASSTTVTGDGTSFTAGMVGSVIRFGSDNQVVPTGPTGAAPAALERTITAFTSASSIEVDEAMPATDSVTYLISDPIDIEITSMYEYFLRECEKQWRLISRSKATQEEILAYNQAWTQAREADSRDTSRHASMRGQRRRSGFNHYPINFGI